MTLNSSNAVVILHCQFNSHHFEERTIEFNDQVKIGRAVSRSKPTLSNGIFDCKVLSRSHAIIRFRSNEFWLQDTNSSNGTFVNNTRISKRDDGDSCERQIFSGDILKFGVDVVENDVTHGCIITSVTLRLPDGSEAKPVVRNPSVRLAITDNKSVNSEQIFKLSFFVEDITFREEALNKRLEHLRIVLQNAELASKLGWQAMLNEEKLLAKLYLYEQQIGILKGDLSDDSIKLQLCNLLNAKDIQEEATKSEFNKILEEKCLLIRRINELEGSLRPLQDECVVLKENCQSVRSFHIALSADYQKNLEDINKHLLDLSNEKDQLYKKMMNQVEISDALRLKLENLFHENSLLRGSYTSDQLHSEAILSQCNDSKENSNCMNIGSGTVRNLPTKQAPDAFLSECVQDFERSLQFSRLLREKLSPLTNFNSESITASRISVDSLEVMVQKILRHHESAMANLYSYLLEVNPPFASNLLDDSCGTANQITLVHPLNGNKSISSVYATLTNIEKELRTSQISQRLLQEETKHHQSEMQIMRTERSRLEALLEQAYREIDSLQTSIGSNLSHSDACSVSSNKTANYSIEKMPAVAENNNRRNSEPPMFISSSSSMT